MTLRRNQILLDFGVCIFNSETFGWVSVYPTLHYHNMTRISFWSIIRRAIHVMDWTFLSVSEIVEPYLGPANIQHCNKIRLSGMFLSKNLDTISLISSCIYMLHWRKKVKFNNPNWLAVCWVARWPTFENVLKANLIFSPLLGFIWLSLSPLFCLARKKVCLSK